MLLAQQVQPRQQPILSGGELAARLAAQLVRQQQVKKLQGEEAGVAKTTRANEVAALNKLMGGGDVDFQGRPIVNEQGSQQSDITLTQALGQLPTGNKTGDTITAAMIQNKLAQDKIEAEKQAELELEGVGGPFEGTSMDAQSYNVLAGVRDGAIDPNSSEAQLAMMHVTQPKVFATPDGTYIQEGLPLEGFFANPDQPPKFDSEGRVIRRGQETTQPDIASTLPERKELPGFTEKKPTEGETRRETISNTLINMSRQADEILEGNKDFNPRKLSEMRGNIPIIGNALASPGFRQYKAAAMSWTSMMTLMKSGVQSRQDEIEREFTANWTQPGDDLASHYKKKVIRLTQEREAYLTGVLKPRKEIADEQVVRIDKEMKAANETWALVTQLRQKGISEEDILATIEGN
jgi:hypothetical protein